MNGDNGHPQARTFVLHLTPAVLQCEVERELAVRRIERFLSGDRFDGESVSERVKAALGVVRLIEQALSPSNCFIESNFVAEKLEPSGEGRICQSRGGGTRMTKAEPAAPLTES